MNNEETPAYLKGLVQKQRNMLVLYKNRIDVQASKIQDLHEKCVRLQNQVTRMQYVANAFGDPSIDLRAKYSACPSP